MTYARSRLWLGISGVGFWVTLTTIMVLIRVPEKFLPAQPSLLAEEIDDLALIIGAYILLSLPFDFLGGYFLPKKYQRTSQSFISFSGSWLRGVMIHAVCLMTTAVTLLSAGRMGGRAAVVFTAAILMFALLIAQGLLARLVGGLRLTEADLTMTQQALERWGLSLPRMLVVEATDPAFVGGFTGLPGRERLIIPAAWLRTADRLSQLPVDAGVLQIVRRIGVLRRGSRLRGVLMAFGWNLTGLYLASILPGADVTSVAGLIMTACAFTIWSFIGLLTLPSFSRPGVLEGDYFAMRRGVSRGELERMATALDKLQDDEPSRPTLVETIFHPIPSVKSRFSHFADDAEEPLGAWQAARVALFLSWGCLGFLSRAVHCNSGRPELWVLFPGD